MELKLIEFFSGKGTESRPVIELNIYNRLIDLF
jgi:hypothetical protein